MKSKRKIPWFFRQQCSCPDCGFIYTFKDYESAITRGDKGQLVSIDCPRCHVHYTMEEFHELCSGKYSQKAEI
jgi:ssDNA-binding Zn-finger/Zn-ribbon topoisomerase 1